MTPVDEQRVSAWLDEVRAWMEQRIPFNRHLGFEIVELRPGSVVARVPFREDLIGDPDRPALHGGVLSMMADTTGGAAVMSAVEPGSRLSTVDLRVDYLRPARLEDVFARAEVIRLGNRVGVTQIRLDQSDGAHHVADGRAVYNVRRRP